MVWYFQFYVQVQAESLLLTQLTGSSVAVHSKRSEMLRAYGDLVNFLLQSCATDEDIMEAYIDVINFLQSSAVTGEAYFRVLWDKAFR